MQYTLRLQTEKRVDIFYKQNVIVYFEVGMNLDQNRRIPT
jgi:hypothetical protein